MTTERVRVYLRSASFSSTVVLMVMVEKNQETNVDSDSDLITTAPVK